MNSTLDYYKKNAEAFIKSTQEVDFHIIEDRFLSAVTEAFPEKRAGELHLLDFGCGSGRDAKYFLEKGFSVSALDGSEEFCRYASELTGLPVRRMLFEEFSDEAAYEGIWCCSTLLHVPLDGLTAVMKGLERALIPGGILYVSFKYGTGERMKEGRHFTDLTEDGLNDLIREVPNIRVHEVWITGDVRPGREKEQWLNALLVKA